MTAEVIQLEDAAQRFERDRKAFRLKLNGFPMWQIAKELDCSVADVQSSLTRMLAGVTPEYKQRVVETNLERIDDLFQVYYQKARAGDKEATTIIIRLMDRQSKYLGLDVMPAMAVGQSEKREPTRHEKIKAAILRVARGPVIDGEAVEVPPEKNE